MQRASATFLLLLLTSCASLQLIEVQDVDTLYFGTARPGGVVSDAEWKAFVTEVLVPEFPGFTEWNATGHWRGAEEATHVVQIAHFPGPGGDARVSRIVREYKRRFNQESVF